MTLKHCMTMSAALAGAWFTTTLAHARGPVHGELIGGPAPIVEAIQATNSATGGDGSVLNADFDVLASFEFDVADTCPTNHAAMEQVVKLIPESIKKLDGKMVRIRGFMMPTKELDGKATEFLVTRNQPACCYSGPIALNEFISVKTGGKGMDEIMDEVVTIEGTIHVSLVSDGYSLIGLYRIEGGKMMKDGQ